MKRHPLRIIFGCVFLAGLFVLWPSAFAAEPLLPIGVAKVDITPDYPIRLTGYAVRKTESELPGLKLWAKAVAIGSDADGPAILMTVDNCGVCSNITEEVAARLANKAGLKRERFVISSSHTHAGPCVVGFAPNIFAMPIPEEQWATIVRYTEELTTKLEQAALAALKDRRPGRLYWESGRVGFAANRRTPGGPVDHALPVLVAKDERNALRAVMANYACHCTTLGGEFNKTCGDWAGFAGEDIEREFPGALGLVTIGCGADSNPSPRGGADHGLALSKQHGSALAAEVKRILQGPLHALEQGPRGRIKWIDLPFQKHFTRDEWEQRAKQSGIVGYHARKNLERLDRGERLPATLRYPVQTWVFGDKLAMVFLAGEVVVDYALRLKKEFDPERLWVTAYANDVPCYIPSRRILQEGGYEAESSLWYYDRPARLAPEVEDLIHKTIAELLPKDFVFDEKRAEFPPPKSPEQSAAAIHVEPGMVVELVASEPQVVDPVAIDWSADGKLWVVEMRDFPLGMDGRWKPGGRVKRLEDWDGDGRCERATIFLDDVPFPTGITAWRKGVLVCAAPDILYAEDTNGDGRADGVRKLFSGFATENYQARVNSLSLGLDHWMYGANGLIGGVIRGAATGKMVDIRGRDFRLNPETGAFETAAGLTQQGRVRDDWGNWFGCDNSTLLWHFPLPEHYARRNPYVSAPDPRLSVASGPNANQLYPLSRTLRRFNDPGHANRVTSACGLGIYRDELLGSEFYNNAFVCEPVHNLVRRLVLHDQGVTFAATRAPAEERREFLASRDNWFRPVQVRTGPDGALWIVDMYRFVVEHPRWITPDRLKELDLRAGDNLGRIYRVYPREKKLRPIQDLTRLPARELAHLLDQPNGTVRDLIHLELLARGDSTAAAPLRAIALSSERPASRMQALALLDGLGALDSQTLLRSLSDPSSGVREHAVRLSERRSDAAIIDAVVTLAEDPSPWVRYQFALSAGEWPNEQVARALTKLAVKDASNVWFRAAILSSATVHANALLRGITTAGQAERLPADFIGPLVATAVESARPEELAELTRVFVPTGGQSLSAWRLRGLAGALEALRRKSAASGSGAAGLSRELESVAAALRPSIEQARTLVREASDDEVREAAIGLLGQRPSRQERDVEALVELLEAGVSPRLQKAALAALERCGHPTLSSALLRQWTQHSPGLRAGIIEMLLRREAWTADLLQALESGAMVSAELNAGHRDRLLKHPNSTLRERAAALLAASLPQSRADVLRRFAAALEMRGDTARGGKLFGELCSSCHAFRGQGTPVGPNLAVLTDKSGSFLLTAILDPNAAVEDRYRAYSVETRDGRSLSGLVTGETAHSFVLVNGGFKETLLRRDVLGMRASALSLMPEGLENNLSHQDLADLIAYVQSGPAPFGSASVEQAARARAQFLAEGMNGFARLVSAAETLPYPSWMGRLPLLHCRQTDGQSKIVWETASVPAELTPGGATPFRLPVAMGFNSQPAGDFQLRLNGKTVLRFDVALNDHTWENSDGSVRLRYTVMENNAEDSNGVLIIECANKLLRPGKPATLQVIGSPAHSQRWFGIYEVGASGT